MSRLVVFCAAVLVACSDGPLFDSGSAGELTCLTHQAHPPGARYTDDFRRTDEVMAVLHYYTAHGNEPFCDDEPAIETDWVWAELYVRLGAERGNVSGLLD